MEYKRFLFINVLLMLFLHLCFTNLVDAQSDTIQSFDIKVQVKYAALDKLFRLYVVTQDNQVIHFNENNKEIFRFANKRTGNITDINVSNPIKIVIYNKDFGRLLELDNTLAEIREFSLTDFGYTEISSVGVSNDDGYWIYDPLRFRLLKVYSNGKKAFESANLSDFGLYSLQISKIIENGNKVILLDSESRFLVFDNFGQFLYSIPAEKASSFQFDGSNIYYFNGRQVHYISLETFENNVLMDMRPEELNIKDVLVSPKKILKIYEKGIIRIVKD